MSNAPAPGMKRLAPVRLIALAAVLVAWAAPRSAFAHCDAMDGPVVSAARAALDKSDVRLALIWIRAQDAAEIERAFARTLAVRKLGGEARALAEQYFFETLVRIHRSGEGEPYTGLKPAGAGASTAVALVDRALDSGSTDTLEKVITTKATHGLRERVARVRALKSYPRDDVEGGRRWVEAYTDLMHYAERVFEAASGAHQGELAGAESR